MKTKRIIIIIAVTIAALVLVGLIPLAWLFTAGLRTPPVAPAPAYWPTEGWLTSTPEEQGFDSAKLAEGLQALYENQVDVDSLLIIRNGYVVLDAHFDPYDGTFPHDLASVTKSVITTLIAIAADQGKLDLDAPMVSFFHERTIANLDERKASITVRDLARMRNGMESGCLEADQPTIEAMTANPDWVQAALDRPMVAEPGTEFCYDSPGMHLLSAILQEATGMTTLDFARQNIFAPLGIHEAVWEVDPQGYNRGWGDLHLLPEDAAKIGYLWLHRGEWNGRQIVSKAWVLDSVKPHSFFVGNDLAYGNGWWIAAGNYYASGRGGQKIHVIATRNTVVVTTGANFEYDDINKWLVPLLVRADRPLPANPQGQATLEAALIAVERQSTDWAADYTPQVAAQISGAAYQCENNPAGIETLRIEFTNAEQAEIFLKMAGVDMILPVGLDGKYRLSAVGSASRGYWEDEQSFRFEVFNIGVATRQLVFEGQDLQIRFPEAGLTIACTAQVE